MSNTPKEMSEYILLTEIGTLDHVIGKFGKS